MVISCGGVKNGKALTEEGADRWMTAFDALLSLDDHVQVIKLNNLLPVVSVYIHEWVTHVCVGTPIHLDYVPHQPAHRHIHLDYVLQPAH